MKAAIVFEVLNVLYGSGGKIIDDEDFIASFKISISQM
jgi:hypothetical protein